MISFSHLGVRIFLKFIYLNSDSATVGRYVTPPPNGCLWVRQWFKLVALVSLFYSFEKTSMSLLVIRTSHVTFLTQVTILVIV